MSKVRKLILPVIEFESKSGVTDYNINGIDIEKAIFFYRNPQTRFFELEKGDYTIIEDTSDTTLRINNSELLTKIERFQVCYMFDFSSSSYNPEFGSDVNVLKDRYNELYEDVKDLFDYIKRTMMVADGEEVDTVLPQLDVNEVWVKTETGYRGFSIADLEANIQEQIKKFEKLVQEILQQIEAKKQEVVKDIIDVAEEKINDMDNKLKEFEATVDDVIDRIGQNKSEVDGRFDLIWRMYSVIIGSNRYLSGNNLSLRQEKNLERVVESGDVTQRQGEPRKVYDGGELRNRGITKDSISGGK